MPDFWPAYSVLKQHYSNLYSPIKADDDLHASKPNEARGC